MKNYLLYILITFSSVAKAQFTVQDIRIGDTLTSYLDFEFWQEGNRFCFQDENNDGYVGLIDSLTGDLVSASGKDFLFDSNLAPITQSINGPEWGYRIGGADVFYTRQIGTNRSIGKATWNGINYGITDLSSSLSGKRFTPICSKNYTDTITNLVYAKGNNILNFTINYSKAVNPVTDNVVPYGANSTSGPRFIDGEQGLLTNDIAGGFTQIFRYDLQTATLTQLTFDAGNKTDAFIFTAPDFGGSRLLFCTVNGNLLRLYKEISSVFVPQYDIILPDTSYHYYFSAEPFVFQNKSYLFLCAANQSFIPGSQNNSLPADVWVVGLEQTNPLYRKVSDNRIALRLDPEVFMTPTEAYIYYYEYKQNGNVHPVAFHKCSSGLGSFPLSTNNLIANPEVKIYPNPFSNRIQLKNTTGQENYQLYNSLGQIIWTGKNIEQQDFSNLQNGIYFLKVYTQTRQQILKLIKQ